MIKHCLDGNFSSLSRHSFDHSPTPNFRASSSKVRRSTRCLVAQANPRLIISVARSVLLGREQSTTQRFRFSLFSAAQVAPASRRLDKTLSPSIAAPDFMHLGSTEGKFFKHPLPISGASIPLIRTGVGPTRKESPSSRQIFPSTTPIGVATLTTLPVLVSRSHAPCFCANAPTLCDTRLKTPTKPKAIRIFKTSTDARPTGFAGP